MSPSPRRSRTRHRSRPHSRRRSRSRLRSRSGRRIRPRTGPDSRMNLDLLSFAGKSPPRKAIATMSQDDKEHRHVVSPPRRDADGNIKPKKFDPMSFERESRGLIIACAPILAESPGNEMKNRVAFSLHPQCAKYLVANNRGLLKSLQQETHVAYWLHEEVNKPKVLEIWADNRKSVSFTANKIRDFLIKKSKEEMATIKAARGGDTDRPYVGQRYQTASHIDTPSASIGGIVGTRGDVSKAIATKTGIDKLDILKVQENGNRIIKVSGMPFCVAYAKCLIQERLRYKADEALIETGHENIPMDELDEELMYNLYRASWTEYFSQKALCDYATVLSNYVSSAMQARKG